MKVSHTNLYNLVYDMTMCYRYTLIKKIFAYFKSKLFHYNFLVLCENYEQNGGCHGTWRADTRNVF